MVVVVVPAFNEVARVGAVVRSIVAHGYTAVVVDDGSADGTAQEASQAGATVLTHASNMGQGAALNTGVKLACQLGADVIVTFDADGQHSVSDIPALIAPIISGRHDVVLGSRYLGRAVDIGIIRNLIIRIAVQFTNVVSGFRITDCHNGLRAMSLRAARRFKLSCSRMGHASEIYDWIQDNNFNFVEVGVTITYSKECLEKGQKNLDFFKILVEYGRFKLLRLFVKPLVVHSNADGKEIPQPN